MQKIDAHQHFWKFDPVRDSWITEEMSVIRKDFFPADLKAILEANGFDGCVAVQADQSETETDFLIRLANENDFIKGVVGWVDLQASNIKERLEQYHQNKIVKGFRHVLQGEPQRDLMLTPKFRNGIKALQAFNFTYDILIFPDQVKFATEMVAAFPEQKFIIDHLAKPSIKEKEIEGWKKDIDAIAKQENVWCKLSGMVTEANWKEWEPDDFVPYLDAVVEGFGIDRILFGSDWPVCLVAATYKEVVDILAGYFSSFSKTEQEKIFGGNATRFYNL
jgi:L-fuconolactonase